MICPILEEISIIDDVMEKMAYFFSEYHNPIIGGLIDEMRKFFTEIFWRSSGNDLYNVYHWENTRRFILRAEQTMDNVILIATKRLDEQRPREHWRR